MAGALPDTESPHPLDFAARDKVASPLQTYTMDLVKSLEASLEKIVLDPKYHDVFMLVKSVRNGIVYGAKVRFPHALVYVYTLSCPSPTAVTPMMSGAKSLTTYVPA